MNSNNTDKFKPDCFRFSDFQGNAQAFTLLEVMIAVAIIATAFVTLLGSQSKSLSLATEAQFNIVAPMLASLKIAEIAQRDIAVEKNEGDFGDEFTGYSWKIAVENAKLENHEGLEKLELGRSLQRLDLTVVKIASPYTYSLTYYRERSE